MVNLQPHIYFKSLFRYKNTKYDFTTIIYANNKFSILLHLVTFIIVFPTSIYLLIKKRRRLKRDKKKYSLKPYYVAKVQVQACNLELLLNDIPIFNYSVTGGMSNEIPLNSYILESGNQILKIRLTPISNHQKLTKQVDFSIDLGYSNVVNENTLDK